MSREYSVTELQEAVSAVTNKTMTYRQAQEVFKVPATVIFNRINGRKNSCNKIGQGRTTVLGEEVEKIIADILIQRGRMGYPCSKEELLNLVGDFVKIKDLETSFVDGIPGDTWYRNFMKRFPRLSLKKPEHLQKVRKTARKPEIVYDFYENLKKLYETSGVEKWPQLIFNGDESGFCSDPKRIKGIGEKGVPLCRVSGGSGRESTTVLACVSAHGEKLPPLIVFSGKAVQPGWVCENVYPGTVYSTSENGWMEEPVFYNWFTKHFVPYVNQIWARLNIPNQKALLFYDGHTSHISLRIVAFAIENNIDLMKFPSHLTDRLQPLDKSVFYPVKVLWDQKLERLGRKKGKGSGRLTKEEFGDILGQVWREGIKPKNCISGFSSTGLFPWDPAKFPEHLFEPGEFKFWKEKLQNKASTVNNSRNPESVESTKSPDAIEIPKIADPVGSTKTPVPSPQDPESAKTSDNTSSGEIPLIENVENLEISSKNPKPSESIKKTDSTIKTPRNPELFEITRDPERIESTTKSDATEISEVLLNETNPDPVLVSNVKNARDLIENPQPSTSAAVNKTDEGFADKPNMPVDSVKAMFESYVKTNLKQIFKESIKECFAEYKFGNLTPNENISKDISVESLMKKLFQVDEIRKANEEEQSKKFKNIRLKQLAYGEVLTTSEVMERLKKAEENKKQKTSKKRKRVTNNEETVGANEEDKNPLTELNTDVSKEKAPGKQKVPKQKRNASNEEAVTVNVGDENLPTKLNDDTTKEKAPGKKNSKNTKKQTAPAPKSKNNKSKDSDFQGGETCSSSSVNINETGRLENQMEKDPKTPTNANTRKRRAPRCKNFKKDENFVFYDEDFDEDSGNSATNLKRKKTN